MRAAPSGPVSGLVTSEATTIRTRARRGSRPLASTSWMSASRPPRGSSMVRPCPSRKRTPRECAMPVPPSTVALPPMPTMISSTPASSALRISSPVPRVEVSKGSRSAGSSSARPLASAISMTAVRPSPQSPHVAVTGRPSGSATSWRRYSPPVASTSASVVPSPPSAMGMRVASTAPSARCSPRAMAAAASAAERDSFSESGAMMTFMASSRLEEMAILPGPRGACTCAEGGTLTVTPPFSYNVGDLVNVVSCPYPVPCAVVRPACSPCR